jgi:hypothetical protein
LDPDLNILDYLQGWQPLVLLQIPALAPLGDLMTIPPAPFTSTSKTPMHGS